MRAETTEPAVMRVGDTRERRGCESWGKLAGGSEDEEEELEGAATYGRLAPAGFRRLALAGSIAKMELVVRVRKRLCCGADFLVGIRDLHATT